jgi:hypothetical protein
MATAVYYQWDALGRPLTPARAVYELVMQCRTAWPLVKNFSWFADETHYQAAYPQDHTPYSMTGWPAVSPRWYVFATDLVHQPEKGFDVFALWPSVLADARAGRIPHLKYLIHKAKLYDVRYGWREQASAGHDHHIHFSFDTNGKDQGLGTWKIKEGIGVACLDELNPTYQTLIWRKDSDMTFSPVVRSGPTKGEANGTVVALQEILKILRAGAGPGGLTADQVRAIVRDELNKTKLSS